MFKWFLILRDNGNHWKREGRGPDLTLMGVVKEQLQESQMIGLGERIGYMAS